MKTLFSIAIFFILALFFALSPAQANAEVLPRIVSVASDGSSANLSSTIFTYGVSDDGRYIAFPSGASNLVVDDTNRMYDIFVHDTVTGSTQRASVSSDGIQGNYKSYYPSISRDGRFVAFISDSTNLVPGEVVDNPLGDVFVHDMLTGNTAQVNVASDGTKANLGRTSSLPSLSDDGRFVVFDSESTNLVPGDTNAAADIFVHDMITGSTTRVSVASDGSQSQDRYHYSTGPVISHDGRFVAFTSWSTNFVSDDTNAVGDIFVHDMITGSTTRVSVASDGSQGNDVSLGTLGITPDNRFVLFLSSASNLVSDDVNGIDDLFAHDMITGATVRISTVSNGVQPNDLILFSSMSSDGRYIAISSRASNLVPVDMNESYDVFVHDTISGQTALVSSNAGGVQGDGNSLGASFSGDGRYIVFSSNATNLTPNDVNGWQDVFLARNPFLIPDNHPPVLSLIGNKTVLEGETLSFQVSASDSDGDSLTYSVSNLPVGASFNTETRVFTWTPVYGQAGNYTNVEFTVMDSGTPMQLAFEDIMITVDHVNRPPTITPVVSQQVLEHQLMTFVVEAFDSDGDEVILSAIGIPSGAVFDTQTGVFSWMPLYPSAGVYTPTFIATDNGSPINASSSIDVVITVGSNPTPVEQSQVLINEILFADLPIETENSYLANLNKVAPFIEQGKTTPAINQLNAFIQKVNQDYVHGAITLADKDAFVNLAQSLILALQ